MLPSIGLYVCHCGDYEISVNDLPLKGKDYSSQYLYLPPLKKGKASSRRASSPEKKKVCGCESGKWTRFQFRFLFSRSLHLAAVMFLPWILPRRKNRWEEIGFSSLITGHPQLFKIFGPETIDLERLRANIQRDFCLRWWTKYKMLNYFVLRALELLFVTVSLKQL